MGLEFIQGGFDFPAPAVQGRQFLSRSGLRIQNSGYQTIDLSGGTALQDVFDDADINPVGIAAVLLPVSVNAAQVRAIRQSSTQGSTTFLRTLHSRSAPVPWAFCHNSKPKK